MQLDPSQHLQHLLIDETVVPHPYSLQLLRDVYTARESRTSGGGTVGFWGPGQLLLGEGNGTGQKDLGYATAGNGGGQMDAVRQAQGNAGSCAVVVVRGGFLGLTADIFEIHCSDKGFRCFLPF